ncbi:MAG: riboflavin biosynthesis protein RibF [Sedimentisphaerales bacterium]|nr:riboflavin biosynthesis protein RibF [Sedimentisphaerales bacterium]
MKIYSSDTLTDFPTPSKGSVVTIGNFDGVHLGHQAIINLARKIAQDNKLPLIGMTFEPSPERFLRPKRAPGILTPLDIKIKLLEQQDLDHLIIIKVTKEFLDQEPHEFVEKILVNGLNVKHIIEGQTFNFGARGSGSMVTLKDLTKKYSIESHMLSSVTAALDKPTQTAFSSSLIRSYVSTSQFDNIRTCLGRDYMVAGQVVSGKGRGRKLGYPTANLELYDKLQLVPEDGVFAGYAQLGNDFHEAWDQNTKIPSAISIGRCITFPDGNWQVEAYLMDHKVNKIDFLGKHILLSLVERIRPQQHFTSAQALAQTIKSDCQTIKHILDDYESNPRKGVTS